MEGEKTKERILIFGGTGYIGKYMVKASVSFGHKTFFYSRPVTPKSIPSKLELHKEFQEIGVTIVEGELDEHGKIVSIIREVDVAQKPGYGTLTAVVICTLAYPQFLDQLKIINAIKVAGNIKRFFPSEFGCEEDRVSPLPPFEACLEKKRRVRRAVEAAQIPYTFVSSNCCGAYFVNVLLRPHEPHDDVVIYGTGEAKAVLIYEEDIAKCTIKVATDPRTCNRIVIYRPQENVISQLELTSLWEQKTGRSFKRVHVAAEELVKLSETLPHPENIPVSILHSVFAKGDLMNFELGDDDIEASKLYPEIEFTTIDQLLDIFLVDPPKPARTAFE